jgi:ATP adenylyltransferase
MNNIWAPWRAEYILGPKDNECIFCAASKGGDNLIIKEGRHCFSIMNRFPYTTGHCMIAPFRHIGDITALDEHESAEIISMLKGLVTALKVSIQPDGFNIGLNIGAIAGAGVEDHIHFHIVPRWKGDTNFMPVLADVHVISEHMAKTLEMIKGAFV